MKNIMDSNSSPTMSKVNNDIIVIFRHTENGRTDLVFKYKNENDNRQVYVNTDCKEYDKNTNTCKEYKACILCYPSTFATTPFIDKY